MSTFDLKIIVGALVAAHCILIGVILTRSHYRPIVVELQQQISHRDQQYEALLQQTQQQNAAIEALKRDSEARMQAAQIALTQANARAQQQFDKAQALRDSVAAPNISRCEAAQQLIHKVLFTQ